MFEASDEFWDGKGILADFKEGRSKREKEDASVAPRPISEGWAQW